jgi:penicillin amidase
MRKSLTAVPGLVLTLTCCSTSTTPSDAGDGGTDGGYQSPVASVPLQTTITASSLSAPVDVVRDQYGVPHIYAQSLGDMAYAQGYMQAMDRLFEIDLLRHAADGSLSSIFGGAQLGNDMRMRAWHLRGQAEAGWAAFQESADPEDQALVTMLRQYALGVNAYAADLQAGKYSLPPDLATLYVPASFQPWAPEDSLLGGEFLAFQLAFDPYSEIARSQMELQAQMTFSPVSSNPAYRARAGIDQDLQILAPIDPTYTLRSSPPPAWTGFNGDTSTAMRRVRLKHLQELASLYRRDLKALKGIGRDRVRDPSIGSNNCVVSGSLSQSGHVMVANDTHLQLQNPPVWWLVHLVNTGSSFPVDVMGVQIGAGIPGIILGMNQHMAWGATVSNIDVTDVYTESVSRCSDDAGYCVTFDGGQVLLQQRDETFAIGGFGQQTATTTATYYDVPQHGPIIPTLDSFGTSILPLMSKELSVKYTGFTSSPLLKAVFGLQTASTMRDGIASLDMYFGYGGQNWVVGDDQGNIGWSQTIRVPRRSAGHAPWKVLPGDGTAEWGPDMDPHYIPHAYNPDSGFIATANNDPIGVTDQNDPFFSQPMVPWSDAGTPVSPLYLAADYDPGTRVGRITKRILAATADGGKLSLDDMQSIQADAVTELGLALAPLFLEVSAALAQEVATPGSQPDLTSLVASASANSKALFQTVHDWVAGWTFDTPTGVTEDNPTAQQIQDSQATLVMSFWESYLYDSALGDELGVPGMKGVVVEDGAQGKLLVDLCTHPEKLKSGLSDAGDSILFDDLNTPEIESKRQIAAKALIRALDGIAVELGGTASNWRWGQVHTLTLEFPPGVVPALNYPPPTDPTYPNGFPRHGENGTVDVGNHGFDLYAYQVGGKDNSPSGPAIRFACELDPVNGPQARNVLPGGEVFDPASPHYADQMALWRKNNAFNLSFKDSDVVNSANTEYQTNHIGRIHFTP